MTDVAVKDPTDLVPLSEEEQALSDSIKGKIDTARLVVPAVKLGQGQTKEVVAGDAKAGHWINSVSGEDLGEYVEVVLCNHYQGRFYSDEDNNAFSTPNEVAPSNWPEEYAGQRFVDIEDAEEQWKAACNANEQEWGKGPPISTTYNFVGLVLKDGELVSELPVRISFKRGDTKTAERLYTLLKSARSPWDRSFFLSSDKKIGGGAPYYAAVAAQGGFVSPEVRQVAVRVAAAFLEAEQAGGVVEKGETEDRKPARGAAKKGSGLGVS